MTPATKPCSVCGQIKALDDYHKNKSTHDGHTYHCKACEKKRQRAKYEANRDSILEKNRAWRTANIERDLENKRSYYQRTRDAAAARGRAYRLRTKYALTEADYDAMLAAQSGACAICQESPPDRLHIDHDHETGAVRGLLCSPCNRGIGHLRDSVPVLLAAVDYLAGERIDR